MPVYFNLRDCRFGDIAVYSIQHKLVSPLSATDYFHIVCGSSSIPIVIKLDHKKFNVDALKLLFEQLFGTYVRVQALDKKEIVPLCDRETLKYSLYGMLKRYAHSIIMFNQNVRKDVGLTCKLINVIILILEKKLTISDQFIESKKIIQLLDKHFSRHDISVDLNKSEVPF